MNIDLRLGDCLELMKSISDKSVDAVITDLPYGVGIQYGGQFEDTRDHLSELLVAFIPDAIRISRGVVLFPSGGFPTEIWLYQNFPPKWRLCWYKGAQSTLSAIGFCDWEMIMVYGDKVHNHTHDHFFARTTPANNGHPCPKSIEWGTWLVSRFSKKGATILDPFMGSGTTGVACVKLGRNFIGMEINPDYFAIAKRRIAEAQMQMALPL